MPRVQSLGITIGLGVPGPLNAITDVPGVRVGHASIHADLADGCAVRTGVTVIEPRPGPARQPPYFAGVHVLNGNGDATGLEWICKHPCNPNHSLLEMLPPGDKSVYWSMPVVLETFDGLLNDINGFHVEAEHVRQALNAASPGLPQEGSVGGGCGMICHEFKGGYWHCIASSTCRTRWLDCRCDRAGQSRQARVFAGGWIPRGTLPWRCAFAVW